MVSCIFLDSNLKCEATLKEIGLFCDPGVVRRCWVSFMVCARVAPRAKKSVRGCDGWRQVADWYACAKGRPARGGSRRRRSVPTRSVRGVLGWPAACLCSVVAWRRRRTTSSLFLAGRAMWQNRTSRWRNNRSRTTPPCNGVEKVWSRAPMGRARARALRRPKKLRPALECSIRQLSQHRL